MSKVIIAIRSSLFYLGYSITLMLVGILSLPLMLLPTHIAAPIILLWNRFVLFWLAVCCGITYQVKGDINNLPKPCVVIANHQSPWETIFLQLQFYPLTTVLKKELLSIPFFGWGMKILKPIAIDRSNPMQALKQIKKTGVERLTSQQSVLIFPEGTRQPVNALGNFARSGADIAKAANVPIVVIAHDAGHYWKNKQFLKTPGVVNVTIQAPISIGDKTTKDVMQEAKQWIDEALS